MREQQGQGGLEEQLKNVFQSTFEAEVWGFELFKTRESSYYLFGADEKGPAVWLVPDRVDEYKVICIEEQDKLAHRTGPGEVVFRHKKLGSDLYFLDGAHSVEEWVEDAARAFAKKINKAFMDVLLASVSDETEARAQGHRLDVSLAQVADGLRDKGYHPSHVLFPIGCHDALIVHDAVVSDKEIDNRWYLGRTPTGLQALCLAGLHSSAALVLDRQQLTVLAQPLWVNVVKAELQVRLYAEQRLNPIVRDTHAVAELERVEESLGYSREADLAATSPSAVYVNPQRIDELRKCTTKEWDLTRLIALCEELNKCWSHECFLAVAMLTRAVLDHVAPIFGFGTFLQVANNYKGYKSFKKSMQHLENSSRNIANSHLHVQIRKKETLPNATQVNFSQDLDVLLSEVVRILK